MPAFKTKKIRGTSRELPNISKKKEIQQDNLSIEKAPKKSQRKYIVWWIILTMSIFFISQFIFGAFSGNEKNGSEVFQEKSFVAEFMNKKVVGTTNILIAGIGGKGHDGSDLTDSIMLASLDGERKTVTLLSIPRDLYVAYPEKKWAWRINSLYDIGRRNEVGIKYLSDKVSEITGQSIDHYMVIDFDGFQDIINILWGIDIDVPESLTDKEYPDNNWGYTTFHVTKWPQVFDGATALKYARSRHSTSDFDRSNRQQLIIKAIKEKATSLWIIANPLKIGEIYNAIISHLDTDLSIANMADIGLEFSSIKSDDISIVSLSDACFSLTKCSPWSYLYAPSRELFWGSAVIIPENAQANKLSYYDDIRKFVDLTFHFPLLRKSPRDIVFVSDPSMRRRTQEIGMGLAKLWFPVSFDKTLTVHTGAIEKSHINIYWNQDLSVWIDPSSLPVEAIKYIESSIPYILVESNEYINNSGPKIEIIIGKDGGEYFQNLKSAYYLPLVPKNTQTGATGSLLWSWNTRDNSQESPAHSSTTVSGESMIQPGEWENF